MKGNIKLLIPLLFHYLRVLDVYSIVANGMSSCIFDLYNLGIDFLPIEVMKGNKTTDWLGTNYN